MEVVVCNYFGCVLVLVSMDMFIMLLFMGEEYWLCLFDE